MPQLTIAEMPAREAAPIASVLQLHRRDGPESLSILARGRPAVQSAVQRWWTFEGMCNKAGDLSGLAFNQHQSPEGIRDRVPLGVHLYRYQGNTEATGLQFGTRHSGHEAAQFVKQPNIIERNAYRDTWGCRRSGGWGML